MRLLPWGLMRSTARRRTEAARGLLAISSRRPARHLGSPGGAGCSSSGTKGRSGGASERVAAVKARFTSRSSSEW